MPEKRDTVERRVRSNELAKERQRKRRERLRNERNERRDVLMDVVDDVDDDMRDEEVEVDEMRDDEMEVDEMRGDEMRDDEIRGDEMRDDEIEMRDDEVRGDEMRNDEIRGGERRRGLFELSDNDSEWELGRVSESRRDEIMREVFAERERRRRDGSDDSEVIDERDLLVGRVANGLLDMLCRDEGDEWWCECSDIMEEEGEIVEREDEEVIGFEELVSDIGRELIRDVWVEEKMLDNESAVYEDGRTDGDMMRRVFEDIGDGRVAGRKVKIDEKKVIRDGVNVSYDIDSVMGYLKDLDVIREGLRIGVLYNRRRRIETDIHLRVDVDEKSKRFDEIAMVEVGKMMNIWGASVYVCFPRMEVGGDEKYMSDEQLDRWWRIWLESIEKEVEGNDESHMVLNLSYAKRCMDIEKENRGFGGGIERRSMIACDLKSDIAGRAWRRVVRVIESGGEEMKEYMGSFLFWEVIGIKGREREFVKKGEWKESCLMKKLRAFDEYMDKILDMSKVDEDKMWVDIGREDGVSKEVSDEDMKWMSWKICCCKSEIEKMRELGGDDGREGKGVVREYIQHYMKNIGSVTHETTRKGGLRDGGLVYRQFYGNMKEMTDIMQVHPFMGEKMMDLAMDRGDFEVVRRLAGGRMSEMKYIEDGYEYSKRRLRDALIAGEKKKYGLREEERVSLRLMRKMIVKLDERRRSSISLDIEEIIDENKLEVGDSGKWCVVIERKLYIEWMKIWINKCQMVFEIVRGRGDLELISIEETQMMRMMLYLMRNFVNSRELTRINSIWSDEGMGMKRMIEEKGVGWLKGVIDWKTKEWKEESREIAEKFGLKSRRMKDMRRVRVLNEYMEGVVRVDGLVKMLKKMREMDDEDVEVMERLREWLIFVVMRFVVVEMVEKIGRNDLSNEKRRESKNWKDGLNREVVKSWYEGGNREFDYMNEFDKNGMEVNGGLKNYLLWLLVDGRDDENEKKWWKRMSFRRLWVRIMRKLSLNKGEEEEWEDKLVDYMMKYNECLFFSRGKELTKLGGKGKRRLISWEIVRGYEDDGRVSENRWIVRWMSGRMIEEEERRGGSRDYMRERLRVAPWPDHINQSLKEIEEWIEERGRRRERGGEWMERMGIGIESSSEEEESDEEDVIVID